MEFSGEPTAWFIGPRLSDTVHVKRLVAMALSELNMISESKEYLDKTDHHMVEENNHVGVGTHWARTWSATISESEENNPSGCPGVAGPKLNIDACGSTSRALEELQCGVQKESTLCFFPFVESELKRVGMAMAAEEFKKRTQAKTPTEVEEFGSLKLWNLLNMPYHMLMEMAHLGFIVSQSPVVYLPPVTAAATSVTPPPGWTPPSSVINPEIGVEGPMEEAPFFDEPEPVVEPNQELVRVSATIPEIYLADSNEEVKSERAVAAAASDSDADAEGSGGGRKAG